MVATPSHKPPSPTDSAELRLDKQGPGTVTAADFILDHECDIESGFCAVWLAGLQAGLGAAGQYCGCTESRAGVDHYLAPFTVFLDPFTVFIYG